MPRNMSFALTTEQFKNRTKDVTRRLGWDFLRSGDLVWGVKKAMGLKKGEKIERLGLIEIISTTAEPLNAITQEDVNREGFPEWSPTQFINFFCSENDITPGTIVNRIEFKYVGEILTEEMICAKEMGLLDLMKGCKPGDLVFRRSTLSDKRKTAFFDSLVGEAGLKFELDERLAPPEVLGKCRNAMKYIRQIQGART